MVDLTLTQSLDEPTPVELRNGRWYKRDDLLGFSNGVSGKVRTSLYLADLAIAAGAEALIYGGSVKAPALGRVASAAAMRGLDSYLVIGSLPRTAMNHPTVRVAVEAGAELLHSKAPYNPALQKMVNRIAAESDGAIYPVPYGVSTPDDWTGEQVRGFLDRDGAQTSNLPDGVTTLVVPLGSGNASAGMIYGLATTWYPPTLERVVLVGVGPSRAEWLTARLAQVGIQLEDLPFEFVWLTTYPDFAVYADLMPETQDGIDFHPTYEGKIVRYLDELEPRWWTARDGRTCFWIVGGPLP